jgi:hypothetical protein
MALNVNNVAEQEMLLRIVGGTDPTSAGDTLMLRLYDADKTPGEGDTFLDYSESDGDGYAAIALLGDSFTIDTGIGDTSYATYAQQTFTYTGGDTLYGYHVTTVNGAGDTILYFAEKFSDGPYTIPSGGGTIKITPRVQLD